LLALLPFTEKVLEGGHIVSSNPISRIFVVDDERVIAATLATILHMNGFSARFFTQPLEALAAVRLDVPDLLISDVSMPGLSGVDLAIQMRAQCPECKILLFSGQAATFDLLEDARKQGYDFDLLVKPVHPTELLFQIGRLANREAPIEITRAKIASVRKEMQMPRSTESVRKDRGYEAGLAAETHALTPTNSAELRTQAATLGITLSQFQQRQLQKTQRRAVRPPSPFAIKDLSVLPKRLGGNRHLCDRVPVGLRKAR
jgi:DNA-binding response OmpR family regulator